MVIPIKGIKDFKAKALQWAAEFDICCILDSNSYTDAYSKFDLAIAVDFIAKTEVSNFESIQEFKTKYPQNWIFGGFSYDLKNNTEQLHSNNLDNLDFPQAFFFVPKHLIIIKNEQIEIISESDKEIWKNIEETILTKEENTAKINIEARFSKSQYKHTVEKVLHEIAIGNIYETNFCMEFYALNCIINPLYTYQKLNKQSPTPFSNYFKWFDKHIISATPERFLAKRGDKLISQPIKGTAKRGITVTEDLEIINALKAHPKELQENVMIVDLVRNDLTKSAKKGTVKVEELFGVYSFKQVHHLISTVVCQKQEDLESIEVIKNTFPMGSMTGAPKIRAMELMEQFERTKRGMYSGAVGYFSPDGDFDFNVIIRTILYNQTNKYLSFQVGSAITYYAIPENEYEECLLKVKAILEVLG
ncbi:anthranilate synthase component I family protein [Pedobacter alpinus]|uniref:Anthranilate synthase component I family protein n=1 Tax=Pedobacter alpinus TaxID=1590643 RepID=A0ABW5TRX4_9SPHI